MKAIFLALAMTMSSTVFAGGDGPGNSTTPNLMDVLAKYAHVTHSGPMDDQSIYATNVECVYENSSSDLICFIDSENSSGKSQRATIQGDDATILLASIIGKATKLDLSALVSYRVISVSCAFNKADATTPGVDSAPKCDVEN